MTKDELIKALKSIELAHDTPVYIKRGKGWYDITNVEIGKDEGVTDEVIVITSEAPATYCKWINNTCAVHGASAMFCLKAVEE